MLCQNDRMIFGAREMFSQWTTFFALLTLAAEVAILGFWMQTGSIPNMWMHGLSATIAAMTLWTARTSPFFGVRLSELKEWWVWWTFMLAVIPPVVIALIAIDEHNMVFRFFWGAVTEELVFCVAVPVAVHTLALRAGSQRPFYWVALLVPMLFVVQPGHVEQMMGRDVPEIIGMTAVFAMGVLLRLYVTWAASGLVSAAAYHWVANMATWLFWAYAINNTMRTAIVFGSMTMLFVVGTYLFRERQREFEKQFGSSEDDSVQSVAAIGTSQAVS